MIIIAALACLALTATMADTADKDRRVIVGEAADTFGLFAFSPEDTFIAVVVMYRKGATMQLRFFDLNGCDVGAGSADPVLMEDMVHEIGTPV